jgi:hypothetical protein
MDASRPIDYDGRKRRCRIFAAKFALRRVDRLQSIT